MPPWKKQVENKVCLTNRRIANTISLVVTWDETKRQINLTRHGIDLADCGRIFDMPMSTTEDTRQAYGESRWVSLGLLDGRVVVLVWTERGIACASFRAVMETKMKPNASSTPFSEAIMAAAPESPVFDPENPPLQKAQWDNAIVSHSFEELKEKLAARRYRGPGKAPLKTPTTIRFDADVLASLRATGKGWQTRVNDAMREWLKSHPA